MNWFIQTITSSIGRKLLMALTGIFLILFLTVHLIGNLQLFRGDGGQAFNMYAAFMTTNPVIKTTSYLLYASILMHVFISAFITIQNMRARPVGYVANSPGENSSWSSRNMMILGSLILIFLVIHLQNFWYRMHWHMEPTVIYDGTKYKDLYTEVVYAFQNPVISALYIACMFGLAFHLIHGFQSAFRTLGLDHKKYFPLIKGLGLLFSILVPALFAIMPLYFYFR